jgi:hypothetical protein
MQDVQPHCATVNSLTEPSPRQLAIVARYRATVRADECPGTRRIHWS